MTEVMGLDSIKTDGKAQVCHLKTRAKQQEYSGWFSASEPPAGTYLEPPQTGFLKHSVGASNGFHLLSRT